MGRAKRDGWATHSSAQPSALSNKDAGACPTFARRKNVALYSSSGDSPCGAAVLTDSEHNDTQRKSTNRGNDGEL